MRIAITGGSGFLGRYIVNLLAREHQCVCWYRPTSDRGGFDEVTDRIEWLPGELGDDDASAALVAGCDAVVHAALYRPGKSFRGGEGELTTFVRKNVLGTIQLVEAARAAGVGRFVFISTCAVHERILDDHPLDETHPLWPTSHYGAHKAAIEKFIHSYGLGDGFPICSLRPTGIYGRARPAADSKWHDLIGRVARGEEVHCTRGGKEVHAADVAKAVQLLLSAPAERITGEAFNCYDTYISEHDVATIAKRLSGSNATIIGEPKQPKHQIETVKLRALGMQFGGQALLEQMIGELLP